MIREYFTLLLLLCSLSIGAQTSTIYLIRHAEKQSDGTDNPHLTVRGYERAAEWSQILSHVDLNAIYSTDFHRTIETAQPTANQTGLDIQIYDHRSTDIEEFLIKNRGSSILIVGHSNSTPTITNAIIGSQKYEQIDHDTYGNLYIITLDGAHIHSQLLSIE